MIPGAINPDADRRALAEQVEIIYQNARPAAVISSLVAGLICVSLWPVTDTRLLLGWMAAIGTMTCVRVALGELYRRRPPGSDPVVWEQRFVWSLTVASVAWGLGGWLVMPADSLGHQALVYFFLMGMTSGAVASYCAHRRGVTLSISLVLAPATVFLALHGDVPRVAMAIGGAMYVAAALRATQMLDFFFRRSFQLQDELAVARAAAEKLARTDELTGLANRRAFRERGAQLLADARRNGGPVSVVMIDLDHFKQINDEKGHAAGDAVLRALAEIVSGTLREVDAAGRWGGEEFVLLLSKASADEAAVVAERLRREIGEARVSHEGITLRITASFGVATDSGERSLDALVAEADLALYQAKRDGRDRVVRWTRAA